MTKDEMILRYPIPSLPHNVSSELTESQRSTYKAMRNHIRYQLRINQEVDWKAYNDFIKEINTGSVVPEYIIIAYSLRFTHSPEIAFGIAKSRVETMEEEWLLQRILIEEEEHRLAMEEARNAKKERQRAEMHRTIRRSRERDLPPKDESDEDEPQAKRPYQAPSTVVEQITALQIKEAELDPIVKAVYDKAFSGLKKQHSEGKIKYQECYDEMVKEMIFLEKIIGENEQQKKLILAYHEQESSCYEDTRFPHDSD